MARRGDFPEDDQTDVSQLLTGHWHRVGGYSSWRTRGTSDWLLIATVSGSGRFGYAGGEIFTHAGDIALLRPGTLHDYSATESWEFIFTHFHPRPEWSQWLALPDIAPGLMLLRLPQSDTQRRVFEHLREMDSLAGCAFTQRESLAMNALEAALLWCDTVNPQSSSARLDIRVRQVMDYLTRHIANPIDQAELQAITSLSSSRIAHLFRAQVGQTPLQYLEHHRINRAARLLEMTGMTVGAIAAEVGFENAYYFSQRFSRMKGLSPRDYRKRFAD